MCLSREKQQRLKTTSRQVSNCILGNFEDRLYQKSQRYAPVLKYISPRLLTAKAVGDKLILQQGDCKNAFCNATLPDNEVTFKRPPIVDPAFQEDDYCLLKKKLYVKYDQRDYPQDGPQGLPT